jgi:hypothetical protein
MAEAFPVSGNIEPASFPHLLVDLHRHGATGSLKVTGPLHPKALYFRGGRILFGSSNDPRDQLGAILIESGRITREQLDEVNAKVGPGNPLAKILAESGFVNQRELGDAARVKVERILADVLSWSSGSFEFEDGVLPKGAVDLKLSTEKLLLAAVLRVPDRAFALRHVELSTVLEAAPEGDSALSEVRGEVWPLLERLDGHRTLKDAIALTRLDEFEASKIACAMLFLGIARRGTTTGEEVDLAQEAQSGFAGDAGHYAVPADPGIAARLAAAVPTAFAFAEAESSKAPAAAPEPARGTEATVIVGVPASGPEPGVALGSEPLVVLPGEPAAAPAPPAEVPAFYVDAPTRSLQGDDTEPGSQPAYVPPAYTPPAQAPEAPEPQRPFAPAYRAPVDEPPPPEPTPAPTYRIPSYEPTAPTMPEIAPPAAPPSRPTQADLAALDALLNPSSTGRPAAGPVARPRVDRPQPPDLRPSTAALRKTPARPLKAAPSRVPLIVAGIAGVVGATVAAWYFFLRSPAPSPAPRPTAVVSATPAPAPSTVPDMPSPTASTEPGAGPAGAPSPAAVPASSATPTPTPVAAAPKTTPTPAPPRPTSAAPAGEARALMRQGALPDAARAFAASLAPGARTLFSLQVLVACAPENVQKAIAAVPRDELFIVPVAVKGKDCYRVCWGTYESRPAAEAALRALPDYFRQGGATPRLAPLAELLP